MSGSCTSTLRIIHMGPLALASMPSSHPLPRMPGLRRSAGRYRFMQPCRPHQATSVTTHSICLFACLIVAAPVVDDPSCNALQPYTTPGTPQMSLAGTGSLHDRQEDALARNERGIFIRSVEIHDPLVRDTPFSRTRRQQRLGRACFSPRPKRFERLCYAPRPYRRQAA